MGRAITGDFEPGRNNTDMGDCFDTSPPILSSLRLRLRALEPGDAPAFHAYAFEPEVARYLPWRPHSPALFAKGFIQLITQPGFLSWAVTKPPADEAIGMVFLHSFSRQHRKAEVAFNLSRTHWNQGLATEAINAVQYFAVRQLGLNRIEATCMPENLASRKVLQKLGFIYEGRMRQAHHRYDGFQDMDIFAILAAELPTDVSGQPCPPTLPCNPRPCAK